MCNCSLLCSDVFVPSRLQRNELKCDPELHPDCKKKGKPGQAARKKFRPDPREAMWTKINRAIRLAALEVLLTVLYFGKNYNFFQGPQRVPHMGQVGKKNGEAKTKGMGVLDGARRWWKQAN